MVHGQYGNHEDPQLCAYGESDSSLKNTDQLWKKKIIKKNINTKAHNIQNQQHTQMSLSRTDQDSCHFSSWHCDNSHALKPMRLDNKTKKNL